MPVVPIPAPTTIPLSPLDLISRALRKIGALASGEVPTSAESSDALGTLNELVDSWNAERLMIFTVQRVVNDVNGNPFNLTPGQQVYKLGQVTPIALGVTPDFNFPRPPRIDRMGIISLNNPAQPLELPLEYLTDASWQAIPVKNIQSTLPQKVWNDNAFPFMNLSFWCIPTVQVQTAIYMWQQLGGFNNLTTQFQFPPAYLKALTYNLAVDLAPEFGRPVSPEVAVGAIQSKAVVKSINAPLVDLRVDSALVGSGKGIFNWLTGESTGTRSVT